MPINNEQLKFDQLPLHLNVGCGMRYIPGYIHVDTCGHEHVDIVTEAHRLHDIPNDTVEILYASHVLEYYDWDDIRFKVLPEWNRVMVWGGILRVAVPDFDAIAKLHQAGLGLEFFIGPLYGKMKSDSEFIYHKSVFDFKKLKEFIGEAGFVDVKKYDWKKTDHAGIDDCSKGYIPHMDDRGILLSLNVEARKE